MIGWETLETRIFYTVDCRFNLRIDLSNINFYPLQTSRDVSFMFQVANTKMPQACLFHCFYLGLDPSDAKAAANRGCDSKYQAIHKSDFREIGHGKQVSEQTTGEVTTHREVKGVHENLKLDDYGLTSQKTCYGGSLETELQISGTFRKETQRQIDGVISTVDVLGKPMSEQSTGFMRMHEQESDRVSLGSVAADRVKSTSFEGRGSDFRLGSSQTPAARLQVGEGTFEESSRIASIDGTRLETSRASSVGGNSIDVRRGYIHSNDMKKAAIQIKDSPRNMPRQHPLQGRPLISSSQLTTSLCFVPL